MTKKEILKRLGYRNLKAYAKDKLEQGKISRKMLLKALKQQTIDNA